MEWELQARNQEFFGAEQISWNRDTSINSYKFLYDMQKKGSAWKNLCDFLSKILLKLGFKWGFSSKIHTNKAIFSQNQSTFCLFSKTKETGENSFSLKEKKRYLRKKCWSIYRQVLSVWRTLKYPISINTWAHKISGQYNVQEFYKKVRNIRRKELLLKSPFQWKCSHSVLQLY